MSKKKSSINRLAFVPLLFALAVGLAAWLNQQAVEGSAYLGLQTVPCIDPAKPVAQSFSLSISIQENGQRLPLPATLGHDYGNCLHSIFTQDSSGQVYVRSNYPDGFNLGQFFDVWKITFNDRQIGSQPVSEGHSLEVTENGHAYRTNLRMLPLQPDANIVVIYQ